jgi:hypothetical protein
VPWGVKVLSQLLVMPPVVWCIVVIGFTVLVGLRWILGFLLGRDGLQGSKSEDRAEIIRAALPPGWWRWPRK